ncbi:hypothetical protein ACHAXH_003982 [Discostella pseudostelligera]
MRTDNEEDYLLGGGVGGGSPQHRAPRQQHAHHHFSGGGSGVPNHLLFPPSLRTMEPQYTAALEYEELRRRYQLEVQQEINLCRRLMEEQQHQLLSESEYRSNLQRLHDIHEMQAQQEQQQGLSQLLARNPQLKLLELHQYQQQQQQQREREQEQKQREAQRDDTLMAYLREDFLLQQRQHQMQQQQQQLQEQLSHDSQQREQEELLAALQACGNLNSVLPADIAALVSSLRTSEIVAHPHPTTSMESPMRQEPPPALDSSHAYVEHFLDTSARQLSDYIPGFQDYARRRQTEEVQVDSTRPRSRGGVIELDGNDAPPPTPQDPPQLPKMKAILSPEPPHITVAATKGVESESSKIPIDTGDNDQSREVGLHKPSKSDPPTDKKAKAARKTKTTNNKKERVVVVKGTKAKKSSSTAGKIGKKTLVNNKQGIDGKKLSIRDKRAIGFLDSRGTINAKTNGADDEPEREKGAMPRLALKRKLGKAADIVLNFHRCTVSDNEVQIAKTWSNNRSETSSNPPMLPEDVPFISQGMKFNLPSLPIEPELTGLEMADMSLTISEPAVVDVTADTTVKRLLKVRRPGTDNWWPSNDSIRKERQQHYNMQDDEDSDVEAEADEDSETGVFLVRAGVKAVEDRLATSNEPGVLEKLPHCKLYNEYCKEKKQNEVTPMFCCQTTEIFPSDVMVCCSVCSTWRHAQCGGHYKHYTAESVDSSSKNFVPICDQCFIEKRLLENNPSGARRIERQRNEHLRRCNATNAVLRQFAFAKHSGQCKWPLGSVPISQFTGHIRNVQARHEKAEKQWKEMTSRLGNESNLMPSELHRVRTKELERLLVCIEDAEGAMDRHNMILFLQNDTDRLHPVGFESPRRNIFDPEDDPVYIDAYHESAAQVSKSAKKSSKSMQANQPVKPPGDIPDKDVKLPSNHRQNCVRQGCNRKSRFDSIFCSDSCGVSTLEADLLKTLKYASKLHPSALRS